MGVGTHRCSADAVLDRPARAADPTDPLTAATDAGLAVIGGGYSGLWTALLAKERNPGTDVVLLESGLCGHAASGRNGGFCAASLTHGLANGLERFPDEIGELERLGRTNLDEIERAIARYRIDCDFERTGEMEVATAPHELEWLEESHAAAESLGHRTELLDAPQVQGMVHSPPIWAAGGTATAWPCWIRPGWPGDCGAPVSKRGTDIRRHSRATHFEVLRRHADPAHPAR